MRYSGVVDWAIGVGNALSQLLGIAVGYTDNGNESVSGNSEWYAQERPLYRHVRDAVDWTFLRLFGQQNHCFTALYRDYLHALHVKRQFENRYGEGVQYESGDPVPPRREGS